MIDHLWHARAANCRASLPQADDSHSKRLLLQSLIKNAKRRLVISTLYIGVEQDELVRRVRGTVSCI